MVLPLEWTITTPIPGAAAASISARRFIDGGDLGAPQVFEATVDGQTLSVLDVPLEAGVYQATAQVSAGDGTVLLPSVGLGILTVWPDGAGISSPPFTDGAFPAPISDAAVVAIVNETVMDAQKYGVVPGGSGLGLAASKAKWVQLVALFNASPKTRAIYFKGAADSYIINSGAVFTKTFKLYGDARDASKLLVANGSTGDVITLNNTAGTGRSSVIADLSIDGNKANVSSGDTIVLDGGYMSLRNLYLANAAGDAIRVGKSDKAIIAQFEGLLVRAARGHGIWVLHPESTDGQWTNVDVGICGLSGVRIEASSQNMNNVHTWGNGVLMDDTDAAGFLILASGQIMTGCQAETNWGDGYLFRDNDQNGSLLSGCKSWANGLAGFAFISYTRPTMAACSAYDNGLRNPDGPASTNRRYAGVYNNGSNHGVMVAMRANDRAVARTVSAPAMSKAAVVTQVYGYAEDLAATPFGWAFAGDGLGTVAINGNGHTFEANRGINTVIPIVLTGNTAPIKADHKVVSVTHATTGTDVSFNSLGTDSQIKRQVTLIIEQTNILIFTNGNIFLVNGAFRGAAGRQITLEFNGTKWVEISRATVV